MGGDVMSADRDFADPRTRRVQPGSPWTNLFPTVDRKTGKPDRGFVRWLSCVAAEFAARREMLDDPVWRVDLRMAKQSIDHAVEDMAACAGYLDVKWLGEAAEAARHGDGFLGMLPATPDEDDDETVTTADGRPSEAFVRRLAAFASALDFSKGALGHDHMAWARVAVLVLHNLAEKISAECGYGIYSADESESESENDGEGDDAQPAEAPGGAPLMHIDLIFTGEHHG